MESIAHRAIKISRFNNPQCPTKSALERNFKARANSKNPNTTFTVVIHPPDLGSAFNVFGNKAKRPKGNPKATPKPSIPTVSCVAPPSAPNEPANKEPRIGPVHEKETIAKVRAIKKMPITPVLREASSVEFPQPLGKVSSK